jgi:hypothetical protein
MQVASTWQQRFENALQLLARIVRVKVLHELVGEMRVASTESTHRRTASPHSSATLWRSFDLRE